MADLGLYSFIIFLPKVGLQTRLEFPSCTEYQNMGLKSWTFSNFRQIHVQLRVPQSFMFLTEMHWVSKYESEKLNIFKFRANPCAVKSSSKLHVSDRNARTVIMNPKLSLVTLYCFVTIQNHVAAKTTICFAVSTIQVSVSTSIHSLSPSVEHEEWNDFLQSSHSTILSNALQYFFAKTTGKPRATVYLCISCQDEHNGQICSMWRSEET